jgi:hypothetical protein
MPRLLKRLSLVFALLAVGLFVAGWITLRVIATNVMTDDTGQVRAKLVADWATNADALEASLGQVSSWNTVGGRTPPATGCQLRWAGESEAVKKHLARCTGAPGPIDEQTLGVLDAMAEQLLVKEADAPKLERDLGWMAALQGHDDWSQVEGTPFEFFDVDPAVVSASDAPLLALRQVRGLALLRLLSGQRSGAMEAAVTDVVALAKALLGRPFLSDQLIGLAVLERTRAVLDAAGQQALGPPVAELQALRSSRLASALLWHPWVPRAQRDRFLPKLPAASRCAAAGELLPVLEVGPTLAENYPDFVAELDEWKKAKPCGSDFVVRGLEARTHLPAGSWKHLLRTTEFITRAEQGDVGPSLLVKIIDASPLGRQAVTEVIFSVTVARPFPAPVAER